MVEKYSKEGNNRLLLMENGGALFKSPVKERLQKEKVWGWFLYREIPFDGYISLNIHRGNVRNLNFTSQANLFEKDTGSFKYNLFIKWSKEDRFLDSGRTRDTLCSIDFLDEETKLCTLDENKLLIDIFRAMKVLDRAIFIKMYSRFLETRYKFFDIIDDDNFPHKDAYGLSNEEVEECLSSYPLDYFGNVIDEDSKIDVIDFSKRDVGVLEKRLLIEKAQLLV